MGNQTNLAIKGIIAIGAMSKMSSLAGKRADADHYSVCMGVLPRDLFPDGLRSMEDEWYRQQPATAFGI